MKKTLIAITAACTLGASTPLLAQSEPSTAEANWRFKVGVNFVSGFSELMDAYESVGYENEFEWPFGFDFAAGQDFSNGLGWDVNVGPLLVIVGDVEAVLIPIGVAGRYSFNQGKKFVPYVRAGAEYLFASGDHLGSGGFGLIAGVGIEFEANGSIGWGFEARYDSTEVEFEPYLGYGFSEDIKPYGFMLGAFVTF